MAESKLPRILEDLSNSSKAALLLHDYYTSENDGLPIFSGSRFESLGRDEGVDESPKTIRADDITALLCLGVNLKGEAVVDLLDRRRETITDLLSRVSADADLWDPNQSNIEDEGTNGEPASAAAQLWRVLRDVDDIGPVKASKLMARKRPRLIPIYDTCIKKALNLKNSKGYWTRYRNLMLTPVDDVPLHESLRALIADLALPHEVTPLRACDVILWYAHNSDKDDRRELVFRKAVA